MQMTVARFHLATKPFCLSEPTVTFEQKLYVKTLSVGVEEAFRDTWSHLAQNATLY